MNKNKFSKISTIFDFVELSMLVPTLDQSSLVLFDVDDVLIMEHDEYRITHPYRRELLLERKKRLTKAQRNLLHSIILKDRTVRLVDSEIINILNKLEEMEIPTAALTKLYTGQSGVIEDFTSWRLEELKNINIDFMKSSPIKEEIFIEELHIGCGIPIIKEGVILTADVDKGSVLESILHKAKYYPKAIIFIDDILENLESVQKICDKLQINFHGFEFKGASLIPEAELDQESEKIRFEILEKELRWISNLKL